MGLLNRMNQKLKEKTGRASKTVYGQEVQDKLSLVDFLYRQTDVLRDKFEVSSKCLGDGDSKSRFDTIANHITELAKRLPTQSADYAQTLNSVCTSLTANANNQKTFRQTVSTDVVAPFQSWVKNEATHMHKNIKDLEKKRVEMDAAANKVQAYEGVSDYGSTTDKRESKKLANAQVARQQEEAARAQHDEQFKVVEGLLDTMLNDFDRHRKILVLYMQARYKLYSETAEVY